MNSERMCRNCPSQIRSGGGSVSRGNCNMMVITVMYYWLAFAILTFFPASAIARIIPGTSPLAETTSKQEQMPRTFVSYSIIQDLQLTPPKGNTILGKYYIKDAASINRRRGLVGSSPPTCIARCGTCEPCKPVHVAITSPHAVISETDYYPEVWRCECNDQYYMP